MERLTTIINGHVYYSKGKYAPATLYAEMEAWEVRECMEKLSEYEATGETPTSIKNFKDIAREQSNNIFKIGERMFKTYDERKYWHREAIKAMAELGERKIADQHTNKWIPASEKPSYGEKVLLKVLIDGNTELTVGSWGVANKWKIGNYSIAWDYEQDSPIDKVIEWKPLEQREEHSARSDLINKKALEKAVEYLDQQLTYEWISVSDRLPETGEIVLVTDGKEYQPIYCVALRIADEWRVSWNHDGFGSVNIVKWKHIEP